MGPMTLVAILGIAKAYKLGKLTFDTIKNRFKKRDTLANPEKRKEYVDSINKQNKNQAQAQKEAQKQLAANEKMKAKVNQGIQKKNPLGDVPVKQINPTSKVDVGAKMQPYVNAQKMGGPKTLNVPKNTIKQVPPKPSNFNLDKTMQAAKVKAQKQQNKKIAQGLKNPVSMESKIKNVMGVN